MRHEPAPPPEASRSSGPGLADDLPIAWTAEWLAICPGVPGFPPAPLPDDIAALWEGLRRRRLAAGFDPFYQEYLERFGLADLEALLENPAPPPAGTPEESARLIGFFSDDGRTADLIALQGGLPHAVAALLALLEISDRPRARSGNIVVFSIAPWLALRRRLLAAPPEVAAAARELADRVRVEAKVIHQYRIALLFPGEPWGAELAAAAAAMAPPACSHPCDAAARLLDAGSLEATRDCIARGRLSEMLLWRGKGLPQGLLARFGPAGVVLLADLYDQEMEAAAVRPEALAAWMAVATRDSFLAMLERVERPEIGALVGKVLAAHPGPALVALGDYLGRRARNSELLRPLLRSLAAAHPAAAAAALERTSPAGAGVLRRLLEEASRPVAWAAPESWPPVLAAPPWERPSRGKAAAAAAVVPLETYAWNERMTWEEGEQESWRAQLGAGHSLQHLLRLMRLELSFLAAAAEGDEAKRATLAEYDMPTLLLARLEPRHALALFAIEPPLDWKIWWGGLEAFLAGADLPAALPALLRLLAEHPHLSHLLLPADSPRVAPLMAQQLQKRSRKQVGIARSWLSRHPRAAATGLVPPALGAATSSREKAAREAAAGALRQLAAAGFREETLAVAAGYGVAAEIAALLDLDPLELAPAKAPKAPAFWNAAGLPSPRLRSGETLPPPAVERLRAMLAFTPHDRPYAGLEQVREACDAGSLADFAWAGFQCWLLAGAPAKEQWTLMALGHLGDDACARRLAPLVREWPGESANQRAAAGVEALALIGSDVALMQLQSIADKVKFKGLQERARQKIEEIAEQRGLSAEELADRIAPDFGLDPDGTLELDFGTRRFRMSFDEQLRPFVSDADGKRLGDLPRPNKNDDAAAAAIAVETWKGLKTDAKSLAGRQILRLERGMVSQRRLPRQVFEDFFAHHPLIRHLARRLVWAAHQGVEIQYFRVAEDGTYADAGDDAWLLPEDCEVSVPHVAATAAEVFAAFATIFSDYQLLQPFPQLERECFEPGEAERGASQLATWSGREVATGKFFGLEHRGWRRGAPEDAGLCRSYEKELAAGFARLAFRDGITLGAADLTPTQTLENLVLFRDPAGGQNPLTFGELSRIEASELLRDVTRLCR